MNTRTRLCTAWPGLLLVLGLAAGARGEPTIEIAGVVGMQPVVAGSCLAVYVPIGEEQALAGLAWYNNDGAVVFPRVLVASGDAGYPEPVAEAAVVAANVGGSSSNWSEIDFSQPVACDSGGLYVVFELPTASEYEHEGLGGGAALGYTAAGNGYTGWFTGDGVSWVMLQENLGMAVIPSFVPAEEGMLVKSMPHEGAIQLVPEEAGLLSASPNPFNPATEIRFALGTANVVELGIYDVRGQMVKRLAAGPYEAGAHVLTWLGVDEGGRRVASGTYIVKLRSGGVVQTLRVVLVK